MKRYSPNLVIEAKKLYSEGKYAECLLLATEAYEKAKLDAKDAWDELINQPPTGLAAMTKSWDTTTQKYVEYYKYIQVHNWEDDIPSAAENLIEKVKKKLESTNT